jgi:microcystin degradation protein MlrC
MARIAVGGFQHETNTFAPHRAAWDDFARADAWPGFVRGPERAANPYREEHLYGIAEAPDHAIASKSGLTRPGGGVDR